MPRHTSFSPPRVSSALVCQLLIIFVLAASTPLFAATWTGLGGDGKWTTAANWSGNVAPVPGDSLYFPNSSGVNDFPALTTFGGIHFTCYCGTRGNSITLGPGGITSYLKAIYPLPASVDFDIALGQDSSLSYGNSYLGFRGVISGAGNLSMSGSGQGAIILFGANTYSGMTLVNHGELQLVNDQALGASDGIARHRDNRHRDNLHQRVSCLPRRPEYRKRSAHAQRECDAEGPP